MHKLTTGEIEKDMEKAFWILLILIMATLVLFPETTLEWVIGGL